MILSPISIALAQILSISSPQAAEPGATATATTTEASPQQSSELSPTQRLQQARALISAGEREQALRAYDQLLDESPRNVDARLARGRAYAWMERWQEAEADLRMVVQQSPEYADAWSALGDMYLWSDRPEQAIGAYEHWMALAPENPAAVIARGRAHRAAGDLAAARADFESAERLGADATQVRRHMASLAPRVQNPEDSVPPGYRWSARISGSHTSFSPDRDSWNDQELSLRHHFTRGSLALELLRAERFGREDTAVALDAYTRLWHRAYANLRYQSGSGLLPDQSWRVEVFQGAGRGWELSASYDHLDFGSNTDLFGIGVGRYVGNYYMRYKALHVSSSGNLSHRGTLRNYYAGNGDDYVEITAGTGRSNEIADRTFGRTVRRSNSSIGAAWVKYFHPQWGFKIGAGYADDVDGFDESRVTASIYSRW